jgi:uncharacterized membrane protein
MRRILDPIDITHIALAAFQACAALYVWKFGPDGPLPMHFNLEGEVNRWGTRFEVVWLLAASAPLTLLIGWALSSRQGLISDAGGRRTLFASRLITAAVFSATTVLLLALGLGMVQPGRQQGAALTAILSALWVIFIALGGTMGKTAPNPWVGLRTTWTRRSRLAWDKANRLLGRTLFLGGIGGLVLLPILGPATNLVLLAVVVFGGAIWATLESWRVWRADPEKTL